MADPETPDPVDDEPTDGEPDSESELDQPTPVDISETDRFSINGRELTFAEFVQNTMDAIPSREPTEPESPPPPAEWNIIWAARRPLHPPRDFDPS